MNPKIEILISDITKIATDAIVNSANTALIKGSGICKAIYEAAGEAQLNNCLSQQAKLETGTALVTSAFNLPAHYIIHTVTPKHFLPNNRKYAQLASCYISILKAATYYKLKTIAIPCLGTGHHGWPLKEAAEIAISTIQWYLSRHIDTSIEKIIFVCYNEEQVRTYTNRLFT